MVKWEKRNEIWLSPMKKPYTHRKFENQRTTQKRHQKLQVHNDYNHPSGVVKLVYGYPTTIFSVNNKYFYSKIIKLDLFLMVNKSSFHLISQKSTPVRARGLSWECTPPYPQRDRKRRLNGAVCRNHRIKRLVPCRCYDGHVKEPYEMSMALGARP